jgi:hypothetical protein
LQEEQVHDHAEQAAEASTMALELGQALEEQRASHAEQAHYHTAQRAFNEQLGRGSSSCGTNYTN